MLTTDSIKNFKGANLDAVENFHGNQLVYIGWDKHLMFCAPVCVPLPPEAPFGAIVQDVLPGAYGQHPDFANIDWDKVEWTIDGEAASPDLGKSLKDHGVGHKSLIRFVTPGLSGIKGSAS